MTWSVPHSENESQQSVNDFWHCILGNLSGDWLQTSLNEVLAAFRGKNNIYTLPAPSWKCVSMECQHFLVLNLG